LVSFYSPQRAFANQACRDDYEVERLDDGFLGIGGDRYDSDSDKPHTLGYVEDTGGAAGTQPVCGDDINNDGVDLAVIRWDRDANREKLWRYISTDDEGRHIFVFTAIDQSSYPDSWIQDNIENGNTLILNSDLSAVTGTSSLTVTDPLGAYSDIASAEQQDIGLSDDVADSVASTEESAEPQTTCEDGGGMSWLFCQVLKAASGILEFIDNQMTGLLSMRPGFFDNKALKESWTVLRNIAYAILVPVILLMIISTALGFEFVSAYTVKSALPRMVIATIFIALSYEITTFFVEFVQVVGYGIHNILLYPFSDVYGLSSTTTLVETLPAPETFTGGVAVSGLVGWGAVAAVSAVAGGGIVATLAGFAGVAALALLAVLTLLLFRQTIIVLLVLVSPIAIIAWIFPGRTTVWNVWNKTFWLMMWFFPIIMATTAVGKIMATLIANSEVF